MSRASPCETRKKRSRWSDKVRASRIVLACDTNRFCEEPAANQFRFIARPSRLMQNPLGAAFARKVLRCKARDEGRTLVLFDEERNAAAGHFSCKPFGAVLGGARRSGRAKATAQRRRAIDRAPRPCFAPSTSPAVPATRGAPRRRRGAGGAH